MTIRTATIALAAAFALLASPALAHPKLLSSTPAANGSAGTVKQITLKFSEGLVGPVSGGTLSMKMGDQNMDMSVKTAVAKDGKTLVATVPQPLPAGQYIFDWHVVSTDTHRVAGKLAFTVK
ncbi:MAG TPA: copper homeostasis periplasmic binding protein CopC [Sphingobium sp.]